MNTIYIKNTMAKGCVTLCKLDFDDREIKLANAVFSLWSYNEETGEYDVPVAEDLVTDEKGILTIADLVPGKYQLVETRAPDGYYLSKSNAAEFEIRLNSDGLIEGCEEIELLNQKLASVEIIKRDAADSEIAL